MNQNEMALDMTIEGILERMGRDANCHAVTLSDEQGLAIGKYTAQEDTTDAMSAISSVGADLKHWVERELSFSAVDEISTVNDNKLRLVCRYFEVNETAFTLSFIVPPYQSYRQASNNAIRDIKIGLFAEDSV